MGHAGSVNTARAISLDMELASFCESEHRRLVGLLALYVGERPIAEELAQDAFARLCEHWPRVSGMGNRRAWLNRVALNLAKSWFRRKAAERRAYRRHESGDDPHPHDRASAIAIREAVSGLPERQRMALVLRYFADYSVADTAELMGCAQGTVKSLTHRAIETLRDRGGLVEIEEAADAR